MALATVASQSQTAATPAAPQQASSPATSAERALLNQYCVTCHNARLKTAGLEFDSLDPAKAPEHADVWEKVIRKLRAGMMPPVGVPRPPQAAVNGLVAHLETAIDRATLAAPTLRRPILHRLNRSEYGNAIRDLLALDIDVSSLLPPDDEAYGFDNVADVQSVSPALMERYLSAAWKVSALAVGDPKISPWLETYRVRGDLSQHDHVPGLPLGTRGGILIRHYFPVDGEYVISPRLYRETVNIIRGLELPDDLEVTLDGERLVVAKFGGPVDEQANYLQPTLAGDEMEKRFQKRLAVKAGMHDVGVAFLKKSSSTTLELLQPFERERIDPITPVGIPELDKVTIEGPFKVTGPGNSASRQRILTCHPANDADATSPASAKAPARSRRSSPEIEANEGGCAARIFSTLGRRAFRGPVSDAEMNRLMSFYRRDRDKGGSFDSAIQASLAYLLVSPQYLFRAERDPEGIRPDTIYRISDLELASRLAFFIWSSIPDDDLLNAATRGQLQNAAVLDRQVKRMLADERARALGANFAGQWLYLRNLKGLLPDADVFPDFDHNLREALQRETEMLFESVVLEDRSVVDLLNADYTFVNERLARHYGIPGIYGTQFRRVPVTDPARRGLLGQGSILALTSYPNRTSPVTRGKYVLTNILGTPPPPPPPNVPPLDEKPGKMLSMRERMEEHRKSPACAGCHRLMDPIGLSLENFDGIGRWRTSDNGARIDASSQLFDGTTVDGPAGLRQAVLARKDLFARNLTEMLMTYALGRGVEYYDMPFVRSILRESTRTDYRFSSLVLGIVKSAPFQMRRSES
jgi:cytochrome c551/c552